MTDKRNTVSDFTTRKLSRKTKRLVSILNRDTNIECCDEPTKNLFIGNAGLTTGLQRECLLSKCLEYGAVEDIVMIPDKSYCFVVFRDVDSCRNAFDNLHGKILHPNYPGVLYLAYAKSYPVIEKSDWANVPPGLIVIPNFVSEDEEKTLLQSIDWERATIEESLKHRKVLHYGYQFQYHNNSINTDNPLDEKIPKECNILFQRLKEMGHISSDPNQMTVNQYLPGQGIPPHIDTHSACQETILSLSLGASVVMDFKHPDSKNVSVVLPQRSMLIMSGEARYAWRHGITPRKTDIVPSLGGLTLQMRGVRTSFTFRWTRNDECHCSYHRECDSYKKRMNTLDESDVNAVQLEEKHVLKVYEDIAEHFSDTRHKPWQNVLDFVLSFPTGSILIDVGCGNGKYFGHHNSIYEIGCDTSWNLSKVCKERGFQVFTSNCLAIPFKDNSADACISIAVIHHLASKSRRMKALFEIERILRPQGKALIYVWAKNQEYDNNKSSYLKQNKQMAKLHKQRIRNNANSSLSEVMNEVPINDNPNMSDLQNKQDLTFSLPVHTNRTQFSHTDVFVPWKLKPKFQKSVETEIQTFYRYYHVFEKEELEEMGKALKYSEIEKCFYDQGNWCIIIQKKKVT